MGKQRRSSPDGNRRRRWRRLRIEALQGRYCLSVGYSLLKDINPTQTIVENNPERLSPAESHAYFSAFTFEGGRVWRSDGTRDGTSAFSNVAAVSKAIPFPRTDDALVFGSDGEISLWRVAGDRSIGDRVFTFPFVERSVEPFAFVGEHLFFRVGLGQLWKSDGTAAGTQLVTTLVSIDSEFTATDDAFYFVGNDGSSGVELWRSNGTSEGTFRISDTAPGNSNPGRFQTARLRDRVYFMQRPANILWGTDGTLQGTSIVRSFATNSAISGTSMVALRDNLVFPVYDSAYGAEIWASDGTTNGTRLIRDIRPGSAGSSPRFLQVVSQTCFFTANDGTHGEELWMVEEPSLEASLVVDIFPGTVGASIPIFGTEHNGDFVFGAVGPNGAVDLWKTDGTSTGTLRIGHVSNGTGVNPNLEFASISSAVLFAAPDDAGERHLWKTDSDLTTVMKVILGPKTGASSDMRYSVRAGGQIFFVATDGVHGSELWATNGTPGGTKLIKDIYPGSTSSNPRSLVSAGNRIYFLANAPSRGEELWVSDGTAQGTILVRDIANGQLSSNIAELTEMNGIVFFEALQRLWRSDGTSGGTFAVETSSFPGEVPRSLVNVSGTLYYSLPDAAGHRALWKTDGTANGATVVRVIGTGPSAQNVTRTFNQSGTLFFVANDGIHGLELWRSNGTYPGTVLVKDIYPGSNHGVIDPNFVNLSGTLCFVASDSEANLELWVSDGTSVGTVRISDIRPGYDYPHIRGMTNINGQLVFAADDGIHGKELWSSNGTLQGTQLVRDIRPGRVGAYPDYFQNANGVLYFTAYEENYQRELWFTNGSQEKTGPVATGSELRFVRRILPALGVYALFDGGNVNTGSELWIRSDLDLTSSSVSAPFDATGVERPHPGPNSSAVPAITHVDHGTYQGPAPDIGRQDGVANSMKRRIRGVPSRTAPRSIL